MMSHDITCSLMTNECTCTLPPPPRQGKLFNKGKPLKVTAGTMGYDMKEKKSVFLNICYSCHVGVCLLFISSPSPPFPLSLSLSLPLSSPPASSPILSAGKKQRRMSDPFSEFLKTIQKPAAKDIVQHLKT